MKYVLIVIFMAVGPDGSLNQTQFTMDFPNRERCIAAIEETERKVLSRENARALTLECRPQTPWDEPISWIDYMNHDIHLVSN